MSALTRKWQQQTGPVKIGIGVAALYVLACLISMAVGGLLMAFDTPAGSDPSTYQRVFLSQRERSIDFAQTGEYTAYFEQTRSRGFASIPDYQLHVAITSSDGSTVDLRPIGGRTTSAYGVGTAAEERRGEGIDTFTISKAGRYDVQVRGNTYDLPGDALAFGTGSGINPGLVVLAVGAGALGLAGIAGTAMLQLYLRRRDAAKRTAT